ncbi:UNVERIFIED_CONTAM: hypothetical protein PYX00_003447 [Menopon gallinae]|uniref:AN1-type zinc finger and ubiquitin domain-containing protein 1 n=1 Tax=Menopon gallinae TaxID=328185 RepID=A0AAW2I1I8_9NEOP
MMSHYGLPYEFDDHWIRGSLELSIETLTGTAFEIKVSPNDTIMSIKSKIQSVEGIPISQQHLLYNLEELDNSASVRDYSIQNGATLKLVLSMRVGPISTKRLPPVDEIAWRELQELMLDTHRDDIYERLPSGSRVTVLIFCDGEQVNLLKVVENEDGSFSPLSDSWNGRSIRNLFAEEDPEESAKRLQENSVTMGKVQELKERLESLSIQRKEKKSEDSAEGECSKPRASLEGDSKRENSRNYSLVGYPPSDLSSHSSSLKLIRRSEKDLEEQEPFRPRRRLLSCSKVSMAGLSKARKEAENIIRMQKLSVFVDSEANYGLKRPPLPEIRRSEDDKKITQDEKLGKNLREKTARSIAIVKEENDVAPTASICSSQGSVLALASSDEVAAAIAFSPISRDRVSTTVGRSRYKVSRYVLENDERPKTTSGKPNERRETKSEQYCSLVPGSETSKRTGNILSTISNILPRTKEGTGEQAGQPPSITHYPSFRDELLKPVASQKLTPPLVKKRLRCSQCKKKLNITNTYNCRCGELFCAVHRYSEVHNCVFDYKQEGRKLLQQMNPLIAASKLPKI